MLRHWFHLPDHIGVTQFAVLLDLHRLVEDILIKRISVQIQFRQDRKARDALLLYLRDGVTDYRRLHPLKPAAFDLPQDEPEDMHHIRLALVEIPRYLPRRNAIKQVAENQRAVVVEARLLYRRGIGLQHSVMIPRFPEQLTSIVSRLKC